MGRETNLDGSSVYTLSSKFFLLVFRRSFGQIKNLYKSKTTNKHKDTHLIALEERLFDEFYSIRDEQFTNFGTKFASQKKIGWIIPD